MNKKLLGQKAPSFKLLRALDLTSVKGTPELRFRLSYRMKITVRAQLSHTQLELELKLCVATL